MKTLVSLVSIISLIMIIPFNLTSAQTRAKIAAQVRTSVQVSARSSAVTVITPADIHQTSELAIISLDVGKTSSAPLIRAVPSKPSLGGMGTIQQAPQGKLKITLTPKNPFRQNRAYLGYTYPQSMSLNDTRNYVAFSKEVIPGALSYNVKLEKDKKYLVEIIADAWGTSGGNLKHTIGQQASTHDLSTFNTKINISRVVQPSESGWIIGHLMQGDDPNNQWRVYSVSINEMD